MDDDNRLLLKCSVCGNIPSSPARRCGKCGGVIKVHCSECGHLSEWGRHYCEKCGNPLPRTPDLPYTAPDKKQPEVVVYKPKKTIKLEIQSFQDAASEHDKSFRVKLEDLQARERKKQEQQAQALRQEEEKLNAKPATPTPPSKPATAAIPKADPKKQQKEAEEQAAKIAAEKKKEKIAKKEAEKAIARANPDSPEAKAASLRLAIYAGIIIAVCALGFAVYYFFIRPYMPKLQLMIAAKNYLSAFTKGNYEEAYQMLSTNSKMICPVEDYVLYNKETFKDTKEFKNVEVHSMESNYALVKYQVRDEDGNWVDDYTSFVKEQGKWARPYVRTLFAPIDDALMRNDTTQAMYYAQKMMITDPADPRSMQYMCKTAYAAKLYSEAIEACGDMLESIEGYPVKLTAEEINEVMIFLADSNVKLDRKRAAVDAFDRLDERATLTADQNCYFRINRAFFLISTGDYEKAKSDLQLAVGICPNEDQKKANAISTLTQLNGKAGSEAIRFAKKFRIRDDLPDLETLRSRFLRDEAARLPAKSRKYAPQDNWEARHLGGTTYAVKIVSESYDFEKDKKTRQDAFIINVDLLQKTAQIIKQMPLPEGFN